MYVNQSIDHIFHLTIYFLKNSYKKPYEWGDEIWTENVTPIDENDH